MHSIKQPTSGPSQIQPDRRDSGAAVAISDSWVLADTHVHYYPVFRFSELLDAALANMRSAAERFTTADRANLVIGFLETRGTRWFNQLAAGERTDLGQWQAEPFAGEVPESLTLGNAGGERITLIPGHQIITSEKLEVLIIGTRESIAHDRPLEYYIERFGPSHLVIVPWGVGKWLGKRGRIVDELVRRRTDCRFALGDNAGRPALWHGIRQFRTAAERGLAVLPGSDPLPVRGQWTTAGRYGCAVRGTKDAPGVESLVCNLADRTNSIRPYGKPVNTAQTMINQIRLRLP